MYLPTGLTSATAPLSVGVDPVNILKQRIEDVLTTNKVSVKRAFRLSLHNISDELLQVGIIARSVQEEPTYDKIIDSFLAGIALIHNQDDLKRECNKFLIALSRVGGPVVHAVTLLREEWGIEMQN